MFSADQNLFKKTIILIGPGKSGILQWNAGIKRPYMLRSGGIKRVKFYPEIILKASTNNKPVGAFRFWVLAKNFDRGGSGCIPAKLFRHYLTNDLKIPRSTVYRWIDAALEMGLIERIEDIYRLTGWHVGAQVAGVIELMKPVYMPTDDFIQKGWMGCVWSAFLTHFEGKGPKSRAFLEAKTGVPFRTQRDYEAQEGIEKRANFANMGDPSKDPDNALCIDPGAGIYGGRDGHTRRRLPNSYEKIPEGYAMANKGNTGKRNQKLKESQIEGGIRGPSGRLYCQDDQQLKRARHRAKDQDAKNRWEWLFQLRCRSTFKKAGIYDAVTI